jgi:hypothetical protein
LRIAKQQGLEVEIIETSENLIKVDESLDFLQAISLALYEWDIW